MGDSDQHRDEEAQPNDSAGESPDTSLYRWTCPYCGIGGIQSAEGEDVERYVVNAARSHIQSTDGGGHGPRLQLPSDDDLESAILENVTVVATDD